MSTEPPSPTVEQILAALDRTGYMFEQRIANMLGADVSTGWAFKDQDTGTSREIDIFKTGWASSYKRSRSTYLSWYVLGECKSYQWPWVALTKPWERVRWFTESTELFMTLAAKIELGADRTYNPLARGEKAFGERYHEVRFGKYQRAVQLVKLNKKTGGWEAHAGDIFNDITYPLAKAASFLKKQFDDRGSDSEYSSTRREVTLIFPAIFLSSPIYTVAAGEGEPAVERSSHVILERQLSSESVTGRFRYDVVHVDNVVNWYNSQVLSTVRHFAELLNFDGEDLNKIANLSPA